MAVVPAPACGVISCSPISLGKTSRTKICLQTSSSRVRCLGRSRFQKKKSASPKSSRNFGTSNFTTIRLCTATLAIDEIRLSASEGTTSENFAAEENDKALQSHIQQSLAATDAGVFKMKEDGSVFLEMIPGAGGLETEPVYEYYEPKIGDVVLGVVVSCTHSAAEVDIAARELARLTTNEASCIETFPRKFGRKARVWELPDTSRNEESESGEEAATEQKQEREEISSALPSPSFPPTFSRPPCSLTILRDPKLEGDSAFTRYDAERNTSANSVSFNTPSSSDADSMVEDATSENATSAKITLESSTSHGVSVKATSAETRFDSVEGAVRSSTGDEEGRGRVRERMREEERGAKKIPPPVATEVGSVVAVEIVGQTVTGRPLVSAKKVGTSLAWRRILQLMNECEPFLVDIVDHNKGGLVAYVEGQRAFLPVSYVPDKSNGGPPVLEPMVGSAMEVMITEANGETGRLIISRKAAINYKEEQRFKVGSLIRGSIKKVLPYGCMVQIEGTEKRGLLHISQFSRVRVNEPSDVFKEEDEIMALVVANEKGKISLSTEHLESVDGLILQDKERVFAEAEEMAVYFNEERAEEEEEERERGRGGSIDHHFPVYANAKWFQGIVQREL